MASGVEQTHGLDGRAGLGGLLLSGRLLEHGLSRVLAGGPGVRTQAADHHRRP